MNQLPPASADPVSGSYFAGSTSFTVTGSQVPSARTFAADVSAGTLWGSRAGLG